MDNIEHNTKHFDTLKAREQTSTLSENVDRGETCAMYVDENNNVVRQLCTSYYSRLDYDDGSFIITQNIKGPVDKTINFGPLATKLSNLFALGFSLEISGWKSNNNQKLKLVRGKEQYKLAMIPTRRLREHQDLTIWVKDGKSPHFEPYTIEPKEIINEIRIDTDPFEQLMIRYPIKRKPIEFIGNQTIEQYVKQQLREQRRLENV